jgi:hypothetical protein
MLPQGKGGVQVILAFLRLRGKEAKKRQHETRAKLPVPGARWKEANGKGCAWKKD